MSINQSEMQYTLAEIANILSSQEEVSLRGDTSQIIKGICTIQESHRERIAFLVNPLYKKYLPSTQAGAVILNSLDANDCPTNAIISANPYLTYARIAKLFDPRPMPASGIHASAIIDATARIDSSASIGPRCVVGKNVKIGPRVILGPGCVVGDDCVIGDDSRLDANVTLYYQVQIGQRVLVSSGTVIGSDGFGIARDKSGWHKVPQLGKVIIENDVEIGANCAIDRGAIEDTLISVGVKLDNLIQVGHNVRIGAHTAMAGCTGIAGSTIIGKNCIIGGNVGFAGHLTIADGVVITGKTAVTKSIREAGLYSSGVGGLTTHAEWKKNSARLHRLDALLKRVKALETTLHISSSSENET